VVERREDGLSDLTCFLPRSENRPDKAEHVRDVLRLILRIFELEERKTLEANENGRVGVETDGQASDDMSARDFPLRKKPRTDIDP